ncbi:MAG: DUF3997 domain-containing protein [Chlorobi bacterium]|nr:DUF3997 domain-containing protein [Chlorobiota bacterium]
MNRKKYLFAIIVLFAFLFSGCDYIFCKYKNLPDLGNGYKFETSDCKTLAIVNHNNTVMVMGVILNYTFDSTFIIAAQRPWEIPGVGGLDTLTYRERNKVFEESTFLQYWILNKKEKNINIGYDSIKKRAKYSNVYGPFTKDEYLEKREELGVPKELKLEQE